MKRLLATLALGLMLSGCWMSETQLYSTGDWAHVDLAGSYVSEDGSGHEQADVELTVRSDGLIDGAATQKEDGQVQKSVMGLVPITGGSGTYFLMVDRSDKKDPKEAGDLYLMAHLLDGGGIEVFWPQCGGTPDIKGMKRESPDFGLPGGPTNDPSAMACTFSTKEALQRAALEAEHFLETPHIVDIVPMGRLRPHDDANAETSLDFGDGSSFGEDQGYEDEPASDDQASYADEASYAEEPLTDEQKQAALEAAEAARAAVEN